MEPQFPILRFSLHIAVLVGLVLVLQWSLRPWLAPRWRCWLWGLVVLRLCLPVTFGTGWSLYNFLPSPIPDSIPAQPTSQTPLPSPPARSQPIPSTDLLPVPNLPQETTVSDPIAIARLPTRSSPSLTATPAANPAPPTAEVPLPWIQIWAGIWLAGAFVILFGILRNARRMGRWVASGHPVTDPDLLHAVAEAGRRVGVRNIPQVIELPGLDSPALWGALRPTLLLPPGMAHRLDPTQFRHVLLHEFAHIRRHDIALNWLLALLQSAYWFHPLVWLAFNRLRSEREIACDDIALHAAGADESEAYGRTLLHLLSHLARPATSPAMVGILEGNGDLRRRLSHIAGFRPGRRFGFLAAMGIAMAGAVTLTDAQSPASPTNAAAGLSATNLPPVVPLRYTNAFAAPESRDFHAGGNWAGAPRKLHGEIEIGGVILNSEGQPVPNATVQVYRYWFGDDRPNSDLDPHPFTQSKSVTGSDGRWSVPGIPTSLSHRMGFNVQHPDYVQHTVRSPFADPASEKALHGKTHEIRLKSVLRIRGIVLGPDRKPVPDAKVRLGTRHYAQSTESTTDADGRFSLEGPSLGKKIISARANGFGPVVSEIVITADMPEIELSLNPASVFRGRVVDPEGNPLPAAWVSVHQMPSFDSQDLSDEVAQFSTRADAEGRWSWDSGPGNPLKFYFFKEGFSQKSKVLIQPDSDEVTVTLEPPRVIEGIVLDTDSGDPVQRFRLAPRGSGWQTEDARDFDSADGRFSISLDKDHYETFEVTSPTHEPSTERIPASVNSRVQMTIRLRKSEEFAGTVVDSTGRPVPGATVVLLTPRQHVILVGTRLQTISENAVQVAAGDGSFKLNPVRDPQGIVAAHDTGFARVSVEEFRASGRIVLLPWGRVEGAYQGRVDASGFTRLNVMLFAGASGFSRHGPETSPQVAQGGSFTIENLPPGRHQLHWSISTGPNSARGSFLEDFDVLPGETTTLNIQTKGVRVTGTLQLPAGVDFSRHRMNGQIRTSSPIPQDVPKEAAEKLLQDPAFQQAMRSSRKYYAEIHPDGSVVAEDVPPGRYEFLAYLSLTSGIQMTDMWGVRQEFVVPEGATSPIQLGNLVPVQQPLQPVERQNVPLPRGP